MCFSYSSEGSPRSQSEAADVSAPIVAYGSVARDAICLMSAVDASKDEICRLHSPAGRHNGNKALWDFFPGVLICLQGVWDLKLWLWSQNEILVSLLFFTILVQNSK